MFISYLNIVDQRLKYPHLFKKWNYATVNLIGNVLIDFLKNLVPRMLFSVSTDAISLLWNTGDYYL